MRSEQTSLCSHAIEAREQAYAPFSQFKVGAALLCQDGRIFIGVNMENPSYGLTVCAERVAMGTAVTHGIRPGDIIAVAVAAAGEIVSPCGACRQVLAHFCQDEALVWCCSLPTRQIQEHKILDLLPHAFDLEPVVPSI